MPVLAYVALNPIIHGPYYMKCIATLHILAVAVAFSSAVFARAYCATDALSNVTTTTCLILLCVAIVSTAMCCFYFANHNNHDTQKKYRWVFHFSCVFIFVAYGAPVYMLGAWIHVYGNGAARVPDTMCRQFGINTGLVFNSLSLLTLSLLSIVGHERALQQAVAPR